MLRNKISNSRKGIMAFNYTMMIMRLMFLVVVLIVCVLLISLFINQKFNTTDIHSEVLIDGLLYGTGGIGYTDPITGRSYPELIYLDQLSEAELDSALFFPNNHMMSARITIKDKDGYILKTAYYNKEWYDNWAPLEKLSIGGIGGVAGYTRTLPVILREKGGSTRSGMVEFHVLQPKSTRVS
jgi:hypothetical protein